MAGGLDGAGLVAVDMAGVGGDHRLVGLEQGSDDRQVGLGAANQKVDVRFRRIAEGPDQVTGLLADGVQAVAAGLDKVGIRQRLKDLGMGAFTVVIAEAVHGKNLFSVIGLLPF